MRLADFIRRDMEAILAQWEAFAAAQLPAAASMKSLALRDHAQQILEAVFADELQQLRVAHPGRQLELQVNGDVRGVWDENRLHQLLGNLVLNALVRLPRIAAKP